MDFELSQVPLSTPDGGTVSASLAVPFWTAYIGNNQQNSVLYNSVTLGTASVDLLSKFSATWGSFVIQGNYMAALQGGAGGDASLAQTGVVPVGTRSLLFLSGSTLPSDGSWTVTVGGQTIPIVEVTQISSTLALYGGDISAFAGQAAEVRFTALLKGSGPPGSIVLDAIQFSPAPIPEPSALAFLVLGTLLRLRNCLTTR
jgi:hypothetical protein